jgi:protein SDA1
MVESGMGAEVIGDKGKGKGKEKGGEAMWAVMMVRELWKKKVWNDAKTVSIVALAVFHPNTKVQSAAIHFFLGSDNDDGEPDSDEDDNDIGRARKDINAFQHKLNVGNTSSKKGAKMLKTLHKEAHRVRLLLPHVVGRR